MVPFHQRFQTVALIIFPFENPGGIRVFIPSLSFPLVSSLPSYPLTWFLNFVFYIVLSGIFLALVLVQPQLVGYWTCLFLLQMYPLYWKGGYRQRLRTGTSLKRYQIDDFIWGATDYPTFILLLEDILNYLQLPSFIFQGIFHSRHPYVHRDSWHFIAV